MSIAAGTKTVGFDPAKLIRTHQAGVWRYLRALGCSSHEADDLTQDTFLALLERPFQELSDSATAVYLRRAAFHRFVSLRRRQGREVIREDLEQLTRWWVEWAEPDHGERLLDHLRQCVERLTERARRCLEYRYQERMSRAEIASRLEVSEHGARNLLQRTKERLRQCVEEKLSHETDTL